MKIFLTSLFIMFFGIAQSQKTFYASVDLFTKMSFNSTHPFEWDTKNANVSPLFEYNHSSVTIADPLRLGVSLGWNINQKHSIEIGAHYDGVTSKSNFRMTTYQEAIGYYTPNVATSLGRSQQNRYFINYKYSLLNRKDKTSLSLIGSLGLVTRAGPKEVADVGIIGSSGIIVKDSILFDYENASYTSNSNKALQLGLGLSSNIYVSNKYWVTLSFQFAYSGRYLGSDENSFRLIYLNSGDTYKYVFSEYNRAMGVYFGVSRHFYLDKIFKKKEK
ncbi:hypothetical protein [Brumimicrobium mesophilum]|uniref:hypothetical protein n=1 Tax=Brumimicrobium mesophilum TaxID=392717 RepID=UPI000D141B8B|nr:hypothetical protein [Brumimicrobium mesophilum]